MKTQNLNLITATALVVVAATVALSITLHPSAGEDSRSRSDSIGIATSTERRQADRGAVAHRSPQTGLPAATRRESPARTGTDPAPIRRFTLRVPSGHPNAAALSERAARVESFANARLDRLTAQLDLTPEQRQKLFPLLVRSSGSFDPAMRVGGVGTPAGSVPEKIEDVLEPAQEDKLLEETMNDLALWEEIIANLQHRLEQQIPPASPATPPATTPPATPGRGRGNLFDSVEQDQ